MASTFEFNIAFTLAVNTGKEGEVALTSAELWQGIKRGGRHPDDFAEYVTACEVLSGGKREFRRRLTLGQGAVHTAAGETLEQDVWILDGLSVSRFPRFQAAAAYSVCWRLGENYNHIFYTEAETFDEGSLPNGGHRSENLFSSLVWCCRRRQRFESFLDGNV